MSGGIRKLDWLGRRLNPLGRIELFAFLYGQVGNSRHKTRDEGGDENHVQVGLSFGVVPLVMLLAFLSNLAGPGVDGQLGGRRVLDQVRVIVLVCVIIRSSCESREPKHEAGECLTIFLGEGPFRELG